MPFTDTKQCRSLKPAEIIASLQSAPAVLNALLRPLPEEICAFHPAEGHWCAKEIVGHLIEEDRRDFLGRIRLMLDFDEPRLSVNDQDAVARTRQDCGRNVNDLLEEFAAGRRAGGNLSFIETLGEKDLRRGGVHPKIGRLEICHLLHEWIYHDLNHVRQIAANVQSFLAEHLGNMENFYK